MINYLSCPKCTNTGLSIIDYEINGKMLKGVQCNNCKEIVWLFQDNSEGISDLIDRIEEIESRVSDLES